MKMSILFNFALIIIVLSFVACSTPTKVTTVETLTISVAASLKSSIEQIKMLYKEVNPNVELTINFGSSGDLQQQIENGAPVDIFISASKKQMKALDDKGLLLDGTKKDLLENKLVLIAPKDKTNICGFEDLVTDKIKQIALGEPASVPAGQYAEEVFAKLGFLDKIKPKAVYGKDVKQVLTYVEQGEVDAGIVYATDAKGSNKVIIVATAPDGSHTPVIYSVAVIKSSEKASAAKEFLKFVYSDKARTIFAEEGFENYELFIEL